jgi:hypothetical protein
MNEARHQFPRRFSKGIIASMTFSHSLELKATKCFISKTNGHVVPPPLKVTNQMKGAKRCHSCISLALSTHQQSAPVGLLHRQKTFLVIGCRSQA